MLVNQLCYGIYTLAQKLTRLAFLDVNVMVYPESNNFKSVIAFNVVRKGNNKKEEIYVRCQLQHW